MKLIKNNKKKKTTIIVFAVIIFIVFAFFGTLYYITSTVNNYTFAEKKWINENVSKSLDVYVEPNLPIFSSNGSGVFNDYIKALKDDTNLTLNIISTEANDTIKLKNKNDISDKDVVIYKDHFVVVGQIDSVNKLTDLNNKKIGVLSSDAETISYYLTEYKSISLTEYDDVEDLMAYYQNDEIDYMIIPMYKYLDRIITNKYEIIYHLDGLYSYYCLETNDKDSELSSVASKFYYRWEETAKSKINEYFLNLYFTEKNYSEMDKEAITNEDLIVGYISNLPFEGMIHNKFTGLTDTYLSKFADMTGVTYKYIEYDDTKKLNSALSSSKVDLVLNYYSLNSDNYTSTRTLGTTEYVVLAHVDNNIVVNSLYSLVNSNVNMLSTMNLKYNMSSKNLFEIKDYANIKTLLKNVDKDSIIIIEKEVYDYYKDSKLKNYSIRYIDTVRLNNSFLLNKNNSAFNSVFDFYLSTLSSNEMKNESVVGVMTTLKNNRIIGFIMSNLIYIIVAIVLLCFIAYAFLKNSFYRKKVKKEDRLYYLDAMTNLKNRNYLNDNIEFWNSSKIYPQAIIIIDINKLKTLNDKYGHEAGDNQIRSVASVLIRTQKDNTEILRTDGDEFMIYLVGYDEKKVGSYIHKLNREIQNSLSNRDYGVSIGYSMINNEQTTIDDAINDSLMMIRKSKGVKNEK